MDKQSRNILLSLGATLVVVLVGLGAGSWKHSVDLKHQKALKATLLSHCPNHGNCRGYYVHWVEEGEKRSGRILYVGTTRSAAGVEGFFMNIEQKNECGRWRQNASSRLEAFLRVVTGVYKPDFEGTLYKRN